MTAHSPRAVGGQSWCRSGLQDNCLSASVMPDSSLLHVVSTTSTLALHVQSRSVQMPLVFDAHAREVEIAPKLCSQLAVPSGFSFVTARVARAAPGFWMTLSRSTGSGLSRVTGTAGATV